MTATWHVPTSSKRCASACAGVGGMVLIFFVSSTPNPLPSLNVGQVHVHTGGASCRRPAYDAACTVVGRGAINCGRVEQTLPVSVSVGRVEAATSSPLCSSILALPIACNSTDQSTEDQSQPPPEQPHRLSAARLRQQKKLKRCLALAAERFNAENGRDRGWRGYAAEVRVISGEA